MLLALLFKDIYSFIQCVELLDELLQVLLCLCLFLGLLLQLRLEDVFVIVLPAVNKKYVSKNF